MLGITADQWVNRVRAVKPDGGFCRAVGSEGALLDKAATIGLRWLRAVGIARSPKRPRRRERLSRGRLLVVVLARGTQIRWDD